MQCRERRLRPPFGFEPQLRSEGLSPFGSEPQGEESEEGEEEAQPEGGAEAQRKAVLCAFVWPAESTDQQNERIDLACKRKSV